MHWRSQEQRKRTQRGLSSLASAYEDQDVYVVGKEQMRVQEVTYCSGGFPVAKE